MDASPRNVSSSLLQLQKELQDKQHQLTKAYQTSMTLIESNNRLQRQLEEQSATIQTFEHKTADSEMKVCNDTFYIFIYLQTVCLQLDVLWIDSNVGIRIK